ncbi:MAG: hypothetical protein WDZ90_02505 [Candidatus Paceibacterota bacterium]
MKKETVLVALGIAIALVPFAGLPNRWDNIILIIAGLAVAGIAFYARWQNKQRKLEEKAPDIERNEGREDEYGGERI